MGKTKKVHVKYTVAPNHSQRSPMKLLNTEVESDLKSKVTLYPKGKAGATDGVHPNGWASAGKAYTVEIEAGAFCDSVTSGANL